MIMDRYTLTDDQRTVLLALIRNPTEKRAVTNRARIVLRWDEGMPARAIAALSHVSLPTVYLWPARFAEFGIDGLYDAPRPAAPLVHDGRVRARILALTRQSPPAETGLRRWSSRAMARYLRRTEGITVSHTFIADLWRDNNLQPHRRGNFTLPANPEIGIAETDLALR